MKKIDTFYKKEFQSIAITFPNLKSSFKFGKWQLNGNLEIIDKDGHKWDQYKIKIVFPSDYPKSVPILFETGGKIEQTPEFHINEDKSCCLSTPAKEMIILRKGINILNFINDLVIPFLANHTHKQKTGEYANGEYSHGTKGIYEFYQEVFETKNLNIILSNIERIINNDLPKRNALCFCGKNKKYKKCHLKIIKHLIPVNKSILIKDYNALYKSINNILTSTKKSHSQKEQLSK